MEPNHNTRTGEQGFTFVLVIAILTPLLIVGASLLMFLVSYHRDTEARVGEDTAEAIALYGMHDALANLDLNDGDVTAVPDFTVNIDGGKAVVSLLDWGSDGVDNDSDGTVDEAEEGEFAAVQSDGYLNVPEDGGGNPILGTGTGHHHAITAVMRQQYFDMTPAQALYLDDPFGLMTLNGSTFGIDGRDGAGPRGTGGVPGIGTPGSPQPLITQVAANQQRLITGTTTGSGPSIEQVDNVDLEYWATHFEDEADQTLPSAINASTRTDLGDPRANRQVVSYAPGDLTIQGPITGAGILVVNGDLTLGGLLDFQGVLIVRGSLTMSGGAGDRLDVQGAVFIGGDSSQLSDIVLNGSVDIQYDSSILANLIQPLQRSELVVVYWKQQ